MDLKAAKQSRGCDNLGKLYRDAFFHEFACDEKTRREGYRLRYQVYCVENPFEDPSQFPDQLERDAYDRKSRHALLRYRPTSEAVGTVRMIQPDADHLDSSFPFQHLCTDPRVRDPESFPIERMVEVSRFSVSKGFRRRFEDSQYPANVEDSATAAAANRRVIPNMMLGLIESLVQMSAQEDVDYWCAVMEPPLLRLLGRIGIHFEPLGDLVSYHGRRQPCYQHLPTLLDRVLRERPDIWAVITTDGQYARFER